jgi:hypothetical protein
MAKRNASARLTKVVGGSRAARRDEYDENRRVDQDRIRSAPCPDRSPIGPYRRLVSGNPGQPQCQIDCRDVEIPGLQYSCARAASRRPVLRELSHAIQIVPAPTIAVTRYGCAVIGLCHQRRRFGNIDKTPVQQRIRGEMRCFEVRIWDLPAWVHWRSPQSRRLLTTPGRRSGPLRHLFA